MAHILNIDWRTFDVKNLVCLGRQKMSSGDTKVLLAGVWRGATAPNRQAKLGLASGWGQEAPFGFVGVLGNAQREIKLRRHQGPTAGGVPRRGV